MDFFEFSKSFLNAFCDLLLPHRCLSCGDIVNSGGFICKKCFEDIDFITEPCCSVCGIPFDYIDENEMICLNCIKNKPIFDKARAVFLYEKAGEGIVKAFKYADKTEAASYFSSLMVNTGREFFNEDDLIDYILPIPIHRKRLISRKYNQAALLAKEISKKTDIKVRYDILIRTKNTRPQAQYHKKDRFKNVKNVFKIKDNESIKDKNLLLIDDVLTTGATVSECAKVLKKHGANKVFVLALSRTRG